MYMCVYVCVYIYIYKYGDFTIISPTTFKQEKQLKFQKQALFFTPLARYGLKSQGCV